MKVLGVIPARYESTRFPGKPLVNIAGKSMIQRVYEQVVQSKMVNQVVVATDDQRIFNHVTRFGGMVKMTRTDHQSGTDRCQEVAMQFPDYDLVINVQGDEPFVQPEQIDLLVSTLIEKRDRPITTLAKKIDTSELLFNPNVVKVVFRLDGRAMYFSRQTLPYLRGVETPNWLVQGTFYKHIGLYGFQMDTLHKIVQLKEGRYFHFESLEQLRWLENGFDIHVAITPYETLGVDTPEDLQMAIQFLTENKTSN